VRRSYTGGVEVHPGKFLPDRETLGRWKHPGPIPQFAFDVRWGSWRGGWWAATSATIAGGVWTFTDRAAAERAVKAMLAEQPAEDWTPMPLTGDVSPEAGRIGWPGPDGRARPAPSTGAAKDATRTPTARPGT
jgi:hypothetical protein